MENEKVVQHNMGKGILIALAGTVIGFAVWLAVIALTGVGLGGAVGGGLAAVFGMLVATAYVKGSGKPGAVGIIVVALFTLAATVALVFFGAVAIIHRELAAIGVSVSISEALEFTLAGLEFDDNLFSAFLQDLFISAGISVVASIVTVVGAGKKKAQEVTTGATEQ